MGWITRWLDTPKPFAPSDLIAGLAKELGDARLAHIKDLRTLLDNAAERENKLTETLRTVVEQRYYRPPAGKTEVPENRITPALSIDSLNDVTVFDETADAELMKAEAEALVNEQNKEGLTKVA